MNDGKPTRKVGFMQDGSIKPETSSSNSCICDSMALKAMPSRVHSVLIMIYKSAVKNCNESMAFMQANSLDYWFGGFHKKTMFRLQYIKNRYAEKEL
jgi:hypothetical protein